MTTFREGTYAYIMTTSHMGEQLTFLFFSNIHAKLRVKFLNSSHFSSIFIYTKLILSNVAGRGGRKLDDVRDKYQKACRKLHLAHNEYVLLISEAIEVEKDFRTILLPGLLEHQQSIQENFIADW